MGSWSMKARMRAAERHRGAGAWLQHQMSSALRSTEKHLGGTGGDAGQVPDKRQLRGELTRTESPRWSHQPTPAPLPSTASCGQGVSPSLSIAHHRAGRSRQSKAAQLPSPATISLCIGFLTSEVCLTFCTAAGAVNAPLTAPQPPTPGIYLLCKVTTRLFLPTPAVSFC